MSEVKMLDNGNVLVTVRKLRQDREPHGRPSCDAAEDSRLEREDSR